MKAHEKEARSIHSRGTSCSYAVYKAFSDINHGDGRVPSPRSEGGKCGAVLAAEKILREMGGEAAENVSRFDEAFADRFGSLKCGELMRTGGRCNEYVGIAAQITDSILAHETPGH